MRLSILVIGCLLIVSGCSKDRQDLRSPCVGLDDSPCGPKRSVNDWWLA